MRRGVPLGRVAGVEVSADWSLFVLCALLVWTLESGIFPATNSHLSHRTDLLMAFAATAGLVLGILLHEIGHVLQARREGMRVEGITLAIYGGISRFTSSYPSGSAEVRVAFAGPSVSLLLGGLSVLVAHAQINQPVDAVAAWLGYINLSLGVFNLLPAVPLDGGRVLHGVLWRVKGDEAAASRIAADVGRFFAYVLITGGIALFMVWGSFSAVWLVFIGWFLLEGANSESRYSLARQALDGLRVRDVMTRSLVTVAPDETIAQVMDEKVHHTTYPVTEDGRLLGLLTFDRIARVPRREWDRRDVRHCMVALSDVPVLGEDEPATNALAATSASETGHALVVSGGALTGVVSLSDLARVLHPQCGAGQAVGA
jgi:Zn-dependent protease/CBS domain-containing protein